MLKKICKHVIMRIVTNKPYIFLYKMEGKKMKKKIILLLCFIALTAILSGCSSKKVDEVELEKMTEIANHIANGEEGYIVPKEYVAKYIDQNVNRRIKITKLIGNEEVKTIFDVSGQEAVLIKASQNYVIVIILVATVAGIAGGMVLLFLDKLCKD